MFACLAQLFFHAGRDRANLTRLKGEGPSITHLAQGSGGQSEAQQANVEGLLV